jgi:hypothetical protein
LQSFGRTVDRAVIWFLFIQMCEQRNVSPPMRNACADSEFLADVFSEFWKTNALSFPSPLPVDTLGSFYEISLGREITLTRSGPRSHATSAPRKSGGVYYTPEYIVDYIVEETVGKVISGKSQREAREAREIRILDPACGTGRFLLRAYDRIVKEHRRRFGAHSDGAYDDSRQSLAWKLGILSNCIFGVDIDELATEVTKRSLYLKLWEGESASPINDQRDSMAVLDANIRCGNSLLASRGGHRFGGQRNSMQVAHTGGFDVVLGNPPYGAELNPVVRTRLAKQFDAGTTETAALMMLHAYSNLTRPGGVNGFIVPKAFIYSSNWCKVREVLREEMTSLADVGKVWTKVRLEQVIYFLHKGTPSESYKNLKRDGERFENVALIGKQHCIEFGFLLNGITHEELEVGLKIQNAGSFLCDYVNNTRGAMLQDQVSTRGNGLRVIGGKQIQRSHVSGEKGFISPKASLEKNAFVAPGSILVQNIIAHIEKPFDHIKITAAIVDAELAAKIVILDTVNHLTNSSNLSPYFFLAILNSRLMNWYVYRFIYAKAIRTMHFDGPVTSRIPLPPITSANKRLYQEIVSAAKDLCGKETPELSPTIESALNRLYGLSATDVAVIERGMSTVERQETNVAAVRP